MKVILGVTGSVAAFKSLEIGRIFLRKNIKVVPVLTKNALKFVGKISYESLLNTEVYSDLFPEDYVQKEVIHLKILKDADAILVAPATANIIGKFANGIADDLLSTILLSARVQIFFAPAMHESLWENEALKENVNKLKSRGIIFIGPERGEFSDMSVGRGRMSEPEKICSEVVDFLEKREKLKGKRVLIAFGRTEEDLDPVRVISNRSSGKMGFYLFETALKMGADVFVVKGKTDFEFEYFKMENVRTSREMLESIKKCMEEFKPHILIMNAAVSDFIPSVFSREKIKREREIKIRLKPNIDILKEISRYKEKGQIFVGFALEDKDIFENARNKLKEKNLDLIVVNKPEVLGSEFTKIWILDRKGKMKEFPTLSKREASLKIFEEILNVL